MSIILSIYTVYSSVHLSILSLSISSAHLFVCLSIPISFRLSCVVSRSQLSCLLSIICCHLPLYLSMNVKIMFSWKNRCTEPRSPIPTAGHLSALLHWCLGHGCRSSVSFTSVLVNYIWRRVAETARRFNALSCRVWLETPHTLCIVCFLTHSQSFPDLTRTRWTFSGGGLNHLTGRMTTNTLFSYRLHHSVFLFVSSSCYWSSTLLGRWRAGGTVRCVVTRLRATS